MNYDSGDLNGIVASAIFVWSAMYRMPPILDLMPYVVLLIVSPWTNHFNQDNCIFFENYLLIFMDYTEDIFNFSPSLYTQWTKCWRVLDVFDTRITRNAILNKEF